MSPANRGPQGKKSNKTSRRTGLAAVREAPEECTCPECSGADVDLANLFDGLLDGVATLAEREDPLDAELAGALFVAQVTVAGVELVPAFVEGFIPQLEARPGPGALSLLLAIDSVASGTQEQVAKAASAAAGRLVAGGISKPAWAGDLAEPVRVDGCMRLYDSQETMSVLVGSFRRASRGHAFMVVVDQQDGVAMDIVFVDADHLPEALDDIRTGGRAEGLDIGTQALEPAELRWYVEDALEARTMHDGVEPAGAASVMVDEEDGPPYLVLALLVRTRLAALPKARKPAGARGHEQRNARAVTVLDAFADILDGPGGLGAEFARSLPTKLPAKRKKSDGPAPIYQLKVGLQGAKPPIWRRLLVPADVSLGRLHRIIQVAFGWHDGHMHVFDTPYGGFGRADRELGHRAEAPVTLEQVAPQAKDRIRYTYDFGDDWVHEVVVEKVLDRDPALAYPRCTGGRRAAPPDDSGGIWGYEELVEVLADPGHPEHDERLEWLGLDDASQFDPDRFDAAAVNQTLAELR
jgi:hypothetical protein